MQGGIKGTAATSPACPCPPRPCAHPSPAAAQNHDLGADTGQEPFAWSRSSHEK